MFAMTSAVLRLLLFSQSCQPGVCDTEEYTPFLLQRKHLLVLKYSWVFFIGLINKQKASLGMMEKQVVCVFHVTSLLQ